MTSKRRSFVFSLILLTVTLMIGAVLGEIVLRMTRPFEEKRRMYMRTRTVFQYEQENVRFDKRLGFFHKENLSTTFSNLEYRVKVETNSRGFRDDEESLADPAVLILGDSFAFGWGMEKEKTFEAVLERSLGATVLNMGVAGFSTSQEALLLSDWVDQHRQSNAVCVIQFYGNDIPGSEKPPGGLFPTAVEGSNGIEFSAPSREAYDAMFVRNRAAMSPHWVRHSFLADMCIEVFKRGHDKLVRMGVLDGPQWLVPPAPKPPAPAPADQDSSDSGPAGTGPADSPSARRPFYLALDEIAQNSERAGMRVAFLYVPSVRFYEGKPDYDKEAYTTLQPALRDLKIDLIDLRDHLSRDDYYELDDHWKPSGHEKAARAIEKYLQGTDHLISR